MRKKIILIAAEDGDTTDLLIEEVDAVDCSKEFIIKKDGQEVVDYFRSIDEDSVDTSKALIDLVILDLILSKVHGLDILKLLKKDPKHSSIPIIIFSTNTDSNTALNVYENGANSYITKPISFKEFQKNIQVFKKYLLN